MKRKKTQKTCGSTFRFRLGTNLEMLSSYLRERAGKSTRSRGSNGYLAIHKPTRTLIRKSKRRNGMFLNDSS